MIASDTIDRSFARALEGLRGTSPGANWPVAGREIESIKRRIHGQVVKGLQTEEAKKLAEADLRIEILSAVEKMLDAQGLLLGSADRRHIIQELLDDILGLGPLEPLLRDPQVSDILVNSATQVYAERAGVLEEMPTRFRDDEHLLQIIQRIVSKVGRRVDEMTPVVDARLPDGSRVHAIIPPLALRGPALSIRRFGPRPFELSDLVERRALTPEIAQLLQAAVKARLNIVISGGTGSGKTTMLNVLSSFIPSTERIISVEDAAELRLQQRHVVQLEARPANIEGRGEITIRELVRNSLRMRPDRIVIGECRGSEAFDMLQAMNTGHEGSLTTLHANGPRDALTRLEMMLMMTGMELPLRAVRDQIASAVDLVVHVERLSGGIRRLTSVMEILPVDHGNGTSDADGARPAAHAHAPIPACELFRFRQTALDDGGRALGAFEATGNRPSFLDRLASSGVPLPDELFDARTLWEG